jgi:hypothetical protein
MVYKKKLPGTPRIAGRKATFMVVVEPHPRTLMGMPITFLFYAMWLTFSLGGVNRITLKPKHILK